MNEPLKSSEQRGIEKTRTFLLLGQNIDEGQAKQLPVVAATGCGLSSSDAASSRCFIHKTRLERFSKGARPDRDAIDFLLEYLLGRNVRLI